MEPLLRIDFQNLRELDLGNGICYEAYNKVMPNSRALLQLNFKKLRMISLYGCDTICER